MIFNILEMTIDTHTRIYTYINLKFSLDLNVHYVKKNVNSRITSLYLVTIVISFGKCRFLCDTGYP